MQFRCIAVELDFKSDQLWHLGGCLRIPSSKHIICTYNPHYY